MYKLHIGKKIAARMGGGFSREARYKVAGETKIRYLW